MRFSTCMSSAVLALALIWAAPGWAADISASTWTETPAGNNSAPPLGWPSGTMRPNEVSPTAREGMAAIKRWYNRANPTKTSGGSPNVQTLTYTVLTTAYVAGDTYRFIAGFSNTGPTTLNIDNLGAKEVQFGGAALGGREISAGRLVDVYYDGTRFQIASPLLRSGGNVPAEAYGCDGTGVADAAACLNTAMTSLAATGGGNLLVFGRYKVDSISLTVPSSVCLVGPWDRPGLVTYGDYTATTGTLNVTSSRTIHVLRGGCAKGFIATRAGLLNPGATATTAADNLQTAYAQHAAYAGTGITLGDGGANDSGTTASVRDVLILGFSTCISGLGLQLPVITGVWGDCDSGLSIAQIGELGTIAHNHFWPFLNYGGALSTYQNAVVGSSIYFYGPAIAGIANNAGTVRVSFFATHDYQTGNTVIISGAPADTNINNSTARPTWTVTRISATEIDLQGSTFANTGASGNVYANVVFRNGAGYAITTSGGLGCDHCSLIDNRSFAFKRGFHVTSSDHVRISSSRADTWFAPLRQETSGILVDGTTSALQVDSTDLSAFGTLIEFSASGGLVPFSNFSNVNLWGCGHNSIVVNSGNMKVSGGVVDSTPPSAGSVGNCRAVANGGRLHLTGGLQFQNNGLIITGSGVIAVGDVVDGNNDLSAVSMFIQRFDFYIQGIPGVSLPKSYIFGRPAKGYLDMQSSACGAGSAATADAVFDLKKSGTPIGTATFAAGTQFAVFSVPAGPYIPGDVFTIVAPAVPDATLADVVCTFAFGPQ